MDFTSILGQDSMKFGLILNLIDPKIGGVLLLGDRGTGKSTSVRALRSFLPQWVALSNKKKWTSQSIPLVELPLGATEDRLCGTIHLERAIQKGEKSFEPGLLSKVNGGLLYVDEVNLLDDHLIDLLLDSAASGWNTVEREAISLQHPANFILVGSGNPEEGELRPQLLDRFGLSVSLKTPQSSKLRRRIVQSLVNQNLKDNSAERYRLLQRIEKAKQQASKIHISEKNQGFISTICSELGIDGLRGDLVMTRASRAFAAWCGHSSVHVSDIETVLPLCLNHRLRKDPLDPIDSSSKIQDTFEKVCCS